MRKATAILLSLISSYVFAAGDYTPTNSANSCWKIIWNDEFDDPSQDISLKWNHEVGFIRNQEAQYYIKPSPKTTKIENGHLSITADYVAGHDQDSAYSSHRGVVSTSLTTYKLFSFTYGRVETRVKFPSTPGSWSAIWLLGDARYQHGWPSSGEIDIVEHLGKDPYTAHFNVHFGSKTNHGSVPGKFAAIDHKSFNVYAIEWDPDVVRFFVNDRLKHSVKMESIPSEYRKAFSKPFHIKANLAIGGTWGGDISSIELPASMEIDYIRIHTLLDTKACIK